MKTPMMIASLLLILLASAGAQTCETGECSCASCAEQDEGRFTLPALAGLNDGEPADHMEHDSTEHTEHDGHGHDESDPAEHDVSAPGPTEKTAPQVAHDEHEGRAHEAEGGLEISPTMARKIGLQVYEAEGGTLSKTAVFPAEIKLNRDRTAAVSPRYASLVRQVFAEIGDVVKKGDVLAALENRDTLAVYTVAAPLDGIIIAKNLAVGESADETRVLFEVADLSTVWADISIFPQYQHLIRKGMSVEFVAHDGHTTRATVQYISPLVSHTTRTFTARCVLEDAKEDFTPGAFVRARIAIESAQVRVRVERAAVQVIAGETVIFVPAAQGYEPRDVEPGLVDDHAIEIKSGLEPGESYVAVGAFALKAELLTRGMDPHAGHGH